MSEFWVKKWMSAAQLKPAFLAAQPFPHVVIDDFLPPELSTLVLRSFPPLNNETWRVASNRHTQKKAVVSYGRYHCKELQFSPENMCVFHYLHGAPMLKYLATLTDIQGLIPDPHFVEGGFHCIGPKGRLGIHADFSHHPLTGLERRLNLLLYLNPDWQKGFGGELKLYDKDIKPVVTVEPIHNRAVIFATSDHSYHGHPEPMSAPEEFNRRSIALYYYAYPRPERVKKAIFFPTDPEFRI